MWLGISLSQFTLLDNIILDLFLYKIELLGSVIDDLIWLKPLQII